MENLLPVIVFLLLISSSIFKASLENKKVEQKPMSGNASDYSNDNRSTKPIQSYNTKEVVVDQKEQKEAQISRLRSNLQVDTKQQLKHSHREATQIRHNVKQGPDKKAKTKQVAKPSIVRNINQQGLANSIVMAEILGPPRAKKPHKSYRISR